MSDVGLKYKLYILLVKTKKSSCMEKLKYDILSGAHIDLDVKHTLTWLQSPSHIDCKAHTDLVAKLIMIYDIEVVENRVNPRLSFELCLGFAIK